MGEGLPSFQHYDAERMEKFRAVFRNEHKEEGLRESRSGIGPAAYAR